MSKKSTWIYKGAVLDSFGNVINQYWEAETIATSAKKAINNLAYRYRKMYDTVPVTLPGKIERSVD